MSQGNYADVRAYPERRVARHVPPRAVVQLRAQLRAREEKNPGVTGRDSNPESSEVGRLPQHNHHVERQRLWCTMPYSFLLHPCNLLRVCERIEV